MNSTNISALPPYAHYVLDLASYVSIGVSILGIAMSVAVLFSICARRWRRIPALLPGHLPNHAHFPNHTHFDHTPRPEMDATILAVLITIALYGTVVLAQNICWVLDWTALDKTRLAIPGYFLVFVLFALNVRLAVERQALVSARGPKWGLVGRRMDVLVFGVPLLFFACIVAAFVVSEGEQNWLFLPFAQPNLSSAAALFLIGITYFPIAAFGTIIIYIYTFLFAIQSFEASNNSNNTTNTTALLMQETLTVAASSPETLSASHFLTAPSQFAPSHAASQFRPSTSQHQDSRHQDSQQEEQLHQQQQQQQQQQQEVQRIQNPQYDPTTTKFRRAVLLRCILMSLGLVVLYVPTIVCLFLRALAHDGNTFPQDNLWVYFWLNVLPALDCLWTPVLVLWFQERYRQEFFEGVAGLVGGVFGVDV
ncbi:hypothetical protein HDU98_008672 [Podochytrium sp. JEL0797]|nr:hypothetical protein HDU98_008672 [Podochytrium sp. JEL0797]